MAKTVSAILVMQNGKVVKDQLYTEEYGLISTRELRKRVKSVTISGGEFYHIDASVVVDMDKRRADEAHYLNQELEQATLRGQILAVMQNPLDRAMANLTLPPEKIEYVKPCLENWVKDKVKQWKKKK